MRKNHIATLFNRTQQHSNLIFSDSPIIKYIFKVILTPILYAPAYWQTGMGTDWKIFIREYLCDKSVYESPFIF
ncbi:hypothetical protein COX11_01825 [Candidatus Berkelbacteria bacterium CG23_combo_of_CG06-09_8_20_14_all_41_73]|uniref:Uncharacterized protein n=1 Tax=Candidatus Berkelbacteria bacterium CG23_combo_of_CG06-09_8_20_14_all_41_73 TaxID=1974519 RepID=A0A2H0AZJ2_9BACT|nr:MAG: hypothetical protein COX11_01825 [Candidatus Berkelbacteria bacterium CG23_combo_of_CG06-09_8_20_14_all_41_73]